MASMQDVRSPVGYADLLAMPADGRRYEIHGGELVVVPSPLPRHQFAVQAVFLLLHEHARTSGGVALAAPLDVVFDEYDVLQPDVLFFRAERRHLIRPDAVTRHAPDVAVEVLSVHRRRRPGPEDANVRALRRAPNTGSSTRRSNGSKSTCSMPAPAGWRRPRRPVTPCGRPCSPG